MRILIVDDEAFVRVYIKSLIEGSKHGFEVCGEAEDGDSAIDMISTLKPDIVFLDIKMPKVDGIQVLRTIKQANSPVKVIVLSSYNEFDYVRESMKLGAVDYIHKPSISAAVVDSVLLSTKSELEKERRQINEYKSIKHNMEQNKSNLKEIFLKNLINEAVNLKWEVEKNIRLLDIRLAYNNLVCFVISIDSFKCVLKRYEGNKRNLIDFTIKNIIDELFKSEEEFEFFKYDTNSFCIIKSYSKVRSEKDIRSNNDYTARTVKDALNQFLDISISIGISNTCISINHIARAFGEAERANRHRFFTGSGNIIYYGDICHKPEEISKEALGKVTGDIRNLLNLNKFEEIKVYLCCLFTKNNGMCLMAEDSLRSLAEEIYHLLKEKYNRLKDEVLSSSRQFTAIDGIFEAENINELQTLLLSTVDLLHSFISEGAEIASRSLKIKKAVEYIHNNFDKPIGLEKVAEYTDLNSSYLSRLFKKEMGMSLVDYINKYRIGKAAALLRENRLKSYEVAELVGFSNVEYFHAIFKKLIGKTPTEYKTNYRTC